MTRAEAAQETAIPERRRRVLVYAMYDPTAQDSAPRVRIRLMSLALMRHADVEVIAGDRRGRIRPALRWMRRRGSRSVDAIYVESASSAATPLDLAFLMWMRLRGKPIGIYFRDAYQRFRDLYPLTRRRQVVADLAWRLSLPLLRGLATVAYCPSQGLADVLGIRNAVLLPPGTDPSMAFVGPGTEDVVAAISPFTDAGGDCLLRAMQRVRDRHPGVRLLVIGLGDRPLDLPPWVDVGAARRDELPALLAPARVCVIPRPRTRYTDVAIPVKLMDYLALGKPTVVVRSSATEAIVAGSGAVLLTEEGEASLAEGILRVLDDDDLAARLAEKARSLAESDDMTWDARARRVIRTLLVPRTDGTSLGDDYNAAGASPDSTASAPGARQPHRTPGGRSKT